MTVKQAVDAVNQLVDTSGYETMKMTDEQLDHLVIESNKLLAPFYATLPKGIKYSIVQRGLLFCSYWKKRRVAISCTVEPFRIDIEIFGLTEETTQFFFLDAQNKLLRSSFFRSIKQNYDEIICELNDINEINESFIKSLDRAKDMYMRLDEHLKHVAATVKETLLSYSSPNYLMNPLNIFAVYNGKEILFGCNMFSGAFPLDELIKKLSS